MAESTERAIRLISMYGRTGRLPVLRKATASFRAVLAATPADHPDRRARLSNLLLALRMLADQTGGTALLQEVAELSATLADTTTDGRQGRLFALFSQVDALQRLAEGAGKPAVLQALVDAMRQLAAEMPADEPDRVSVVANLAAAALNLYENTGQAEAAQEAVRAGRQALACAPAGLTELPLIESNLGAALRALFESTGTTSLLEEAVALGRRAVAATPAGHPHRGGYLANLGAGLRILGQRNGRAETLAEAVTVSRQAAGAFRADDPAQAKALVELGTALCALGTRTGQADLLAEAVTIGRRAAAMMPAGHPYRAGCLASLGGMLRALAEHAGQATLLEDAVAVERASVAATPADHPQYVKCLCNLANALQALFDQTNRSEAVREAVALDLDGLARLPPDHLERPLLLMNLSGALLTLGTRTGQHGALKDAVAAARRAVDSIGTGDPVRVVALSNLTAALLGLFRLTGQGPLLTEAVRAGREAVAAAPAGHPGRGRYLANLGAALREQHDRSGLPDVLAEAVAACRDAVAVTHADHPNRAGYQADLGAALLASHRLSGQAAALSEAAACFAAASAAVAAPPLTRLRACRALAALNGERGAAPAAPGQALQVLETAVSLLPLAIPGHLPQGDREHGATLLAGLAAQAAAAAVNAGRPARAVELLEQTRGLLVADSLSARSGELARLQENRAAQAEGLPAQFEALRRHIQALDREAGRRPGRGPDWMTSAGARQAFYGTGPAAEPQAAARREAGSEWQHLLARIRAIPGLEDFLHLDRIDRLAPAAAQGPVVYVYADPARGDALILTGDVDAPVRLVPLPCLRFDEAVRQTARFSEALAAAHAPDAGPAVVTDAQAQVEDVLAWLWDAIAGPVLEALGRTRATAGHAWPRVWWCPVGFLACLPFHAAGHHHDSATGERRAVLDRVISSTIPTARALLYARAHAGRHASARTLLIAAAGTPPLHGVEAEVRNLVKRVPGAHRLECPTRAGVLAALPGSEVVHFACHGVADPADPSASRLLLDDYQTAPLTVADISALHLTGAALAYLSACETASTTIDLADEAVHITAAFHLAGYRHVVGTLWPIRDSVARSLAMEVYRQLTLDWSRAPQAERIPEILHDVIRALRDARTGEPTVWAAHVHVGV